MSTVHKPVLLEEVIKYLNPKFGENFIDCTFGGGGHSLEILKYIEPKGKLLGIDSNLDIKKEIKKLRNEEIKGFENFIFVNDNFVNLKQIKKSKFNYNISGILLDLGLSSDELEKSGRGFSFQKDEPLDMRFDIQQNKTASNILNSYSEKNLYDVFKNYGDYPYARRLSESVFKQRKLKKFNTTQDLVKLILEISPRHGKLHPATKVFQALRIAVNNELDNLAQVLPQAVDILATGGHLVVISFHSSEDRIVKNYFKEIGKGENKIVEILTKKPIVPSFDEIRENPRSRSAKMRVVKKLSFRATFRTVRSDGIPWNKNILLQRDPIVPTNS
ncbi:16S rRNA (cytosine(1402)-N(4))-methyltransferase RsmH [Candidatus Parcubacteria bacterium]|nr:16S rRNA (cytosine(1402)-N(4))-methyltransferase RsmH [Patescibacteria group bacterium]MCG2687115.1 16S rRNA (cytosine(1402)-N(4))-methyltransferase RsmH [Candidatus Parcubacteria bacterium]